MCSTTLSSLPAPTWCSRKIRNLQKSYSPGRTHIWWQAGHADHFTVSERHWAVSILVLDITKNNTSEAQCVVIRSNSLKWCFSVSRNLFSIFRPQNLSNTGTEQAQNQVCLFHSTISSVAPYDVYAYWKKWPHSGSTHSSSPYNLTFCCNCFLFVFDGQMLWRRETGFAGHEEVVRVRQRRVQIHSMRKIRETTIVQTLYACTQKVSIFCRRFGTIVGDTMLEHK